MDNLMQVTSLLGVSTGGKPAEVKRILNGIVKDYNIIGVSTAKK